MPEENKAESLSPAMAGVTRSAEPARELIRKTKHATRCRFPSEDKIRIVIACGEKSPSPNCAAAKASIPRSIASGGRTSCRGQGAHAGARSQPARASLSHHRPCRIRSLGIWVELPRAWTQTFGALEKNVPFMVSANAYTEGLQWPAIGANPPGAKSAWVRLLGGATSDPARTCFALTATERRQLSP
jgi:hypothetical protein